MVEEEREAPDSALFLDAFLALDARDMVACEVVRDRYCERCRQTKGQPEALRLAVCQHARCDLRDPNLLRQAQRWATLMRADLRIPEVAPEETIAHLNEAVRILGLVTPLLVPDEAGHLVISYAFLTLHGYLHFVLLFRTAGLAGYTLSGNVWSTSGSKTGKRVARTRAILHARRKELAGQLRLAGLTFSEIAKRLGRDPDTIEDWFNKG